MKGDYTERNDPRDYSGESALAPPPPSAEEQVFFKSFRKSGQKSAFEIHFSGGHRSEWAQVRIESIKIVMPLSRLRLD